MINPELRDGRPDGFIRQTICNFKPNWKICLCVCFVIIIIYAACIIMIVKWPKCDKRVACSGDWLAVREKCFYFSDDTRNWTASKIFCSLQKSELAQIDTQKDMEFLKRYAGTDMHWIGLSRKQGDSWKWTNGTTFNDWFEIIGNGSFAFLSADGVHSSRGFIDIKWICSKPQYSL
ncbi:PREDICTED: C-type lectin domain family 2 member A [Colobus angolensis palliatus]|uniref:C-type lectin domain-containing protein n=1 Tax=Colobus angolensis palliatus TaxID=336983 RepID=A0A2K5HSG5_COLAP|nr:PREDICTED: C-type lectin domain family 2 member A [Colobus angolensis palliatus]